ncbi:MAG: vitamin K epoxide reductase family protein, partial [Planctomycetota bacterium]
TALLISGYLAWSAIRMQPVIGCSGSQLIDCEHVLNSHWSKVLGVPGRATRSDGESRPEGYNAAASREPPRLRESTS